MKLSCLFGKHKQKDEQTIMIQEISDYNFREIYTCKNCGKLFTKSVFFSIEEPNYSLIIKDGSYRTHFGKEVWNKEQGWIDKDWEEAAKRI